MAGNANSGRRAEKPFRDALRLEIAEAGENSKALRNIAKKLIAQAEAGDMQAIKEFADRLDGKAVQQLDVDATVRSIEDVIGDL
jgi:ribosomal protein S20